MNNLEGLEKSEMSKVLTFQKDIQKAVTKHNQARKW